VAFYAYPQWRQPDDARPVHRFWNLADDSHFYTISEDEANWLKDHYSHVFAYEGIAFYAYE
jgi:hypothetical protein